MTVDLLTFGDGLPENRRAARRVAREARTGGVFSSIRSAHLTDLGDDFRHDHASILRERGLGYWLWKPYLVREWLLDARSEFLLYVDAGCVLNLDNEAAKRRFDEYREIAFESTAMCYVTRQSEIAYAKKDLLLRLQLTEEQCRSRQVATGMFLIRRCRAASDLVDEWWNLAIEDDYHFLDDSPSAVGESPEFVDHRHDQSIFSCLTKLHGIGCIEDETWFGPDWPDEAREFPIWAPRHRSGRTFQPSRPRSLSDLAWRLLNGIEYRIHVRCH